MKHLAQQLIDAAATEYLSVLAHNESLQHSLDLQHLRAEFAKHAMQGMITTRASDALTCEEICRLSVIYADELIKQLKESAPK